MRWQLVDDYTSAEVDIPVAVCADIDGLFFDVPPPPLERYTLIGCEPAGALGLALRDNDSTWLGNILIDGGDDSSPNLQELLDLTVTGHQPSTIASGLVDIELEGRWRAGDWYALKAAASYRLTASNFEPLGTCVDVAGVLRERPESPPLATLLGCRPEPPLRAALDALERGDGNPGGARHRRRIAATIYCVTDDGEATRTFCSLQGSVTGARPSSLGDGLLDVSFDARVADPMPFGAKEIWQRWCASGRPAEPGLWAVHDRRLRHEWAVAASCHHQYGQPDRAPGTTYHLDGRNVTDIQGFYCAIGEAINGPGGYFGLNADDLLDCVRGRAGAAHPFRLVWHDSAVARAHLVPGYDRVRWEPAITMDKLLGWLTEDGVEVELC